MLLAWLLAPRAKLDQEVADNRKGVGECLSSTKDSGPSDRLDVCPGAVAREVEHSIGDFETQLLFDASMAADAAHRSAHFGK